MQSHSQWQWQHGRRWGYLWRCCQISSSLALSSLYRLSAEWPAVPPPPSGETPAVPQTPLLSAFLWPGSGSTHGNMDQCKNSFYFFIHTSSKGTWGATHQLIPKPNVPEVFCWIYVRWEWGSVSGISSFVVPLPKHDCFIMTFTPVGCWRLFRRTLAVLILFLFAQMSK